MFGTRMMRKRTGIVLCVLVGLVRIHIGQAQILQGREAKAHVEEASMVRYKEGHRFPNFVDLATPIRQDLFFKWLRMRFGLTEDWSFQLLSSLSDHLGWTHERYQPYYKGFPVRYVHLIVHKKGEWVYRLNGNLVFIQGEPSTAISEEDAFRIALQEVGASVYMWEDPNEEQWLKQRTGNTEASFYPRAELCWAPLRGKVHDWNYRFAYSFDIYAKEPRMRYELFVDAQTGEVLFRHNRIWELDSAGLAVTRYSDTVAIVADFTGTEFRLRESGRGLGIETYNMQRGTNYGNAVDFTDSDNFWNNWNAYKDEVAGDAHWGAEQMYDYLLLRHGRNSLDDNGMKLISYVHYGINYANAFWDGSAMTYGDGSGAMGPLTTVDICGHEMTHGLIDFTADLIYLNESGALNESFSDIFGTALEWYSKPATANWLIGEETGVTIRSMSNPKQFGDPDTYHGTNWYTGPQDYGGVHTNSGVQNHWFYLLSVGGSGTNDLGNAYNVTGITIAKAESIAYRNLVVYLFPSAEYPDARFYSIWAAIDLYGPCSPEVESTTRAWYAVGVGPDYVNGVVADFSAPIRTDCNAPLTVMFSNLSANATAFLWDFGDGHMSTSINPTHTYTAPGTYTVTLIADGGSCGKDTVIKTAYVIIDSTQPCNVAMPNNTLAVHSSCQGNLFDDGGPYQNYGDNTDSRVLISVPGAQSITLNFTEFAYEPNYDFLYIYDGNSISSPLIGVYSGYQLPNGGTIVSSGNELLIRQVTDQAVNDKGFKASWQCTYPTVPPVAQFTSQVTYSCDGVVAFFDKSQNGPSSWYWDFGDGSVSTQRNPVHIYTNSGIYSVKLVVANSYGADSIVKTQHIVVEKPETPLVSGYKDTVCAKDTLHLSAFAPYGSIYWYGATMDTVYQQNPLMLGPIAQDTLLHVYNEVPAQILKVGPVNNTMGPGGYFNVDERRLYFTVYDTCILKSVKVYSQQAGNRTIVILDENGNIVFSKTVYIPSGEQRVELNAYLTPGNDYAIKIATGSLVRLYRNTSGASYPYTIPGLISITHSDATTSPTRYYYFFYDWEVHRPHCQSTHVALPITIDSSACVSSVSTSSHMLPIHVYPNPILVGQTLTVQLPFPVNGLPFRLYNVTGKVVKSDKVVGTAPTSRFQIPIQDLAPGIYYLELEVGKDFARFPLQIF